MPHSISSTKLVIVAVLALIASLLGTVVVSLRLYIVQLKGMSSVNNRISSSSTVVDDDWDGSAPPIRPARLMMEEDFVMQQHPKQQQYATGASPTLAAHVYWKQAASVSYTHLTLPTKA